MSLFKDDYEGPIPSDARKIPAPEHQFEESPRYRADHQISHAEGHSGQIKYGYLIFMPDPADNQVV